LEDYDTIPDDDEPSPYPTSGKLERLELISLGFRAVASLPDFALDALDGNRSVVFKFCPMLKIPDDEDTDGSDDDDIFWDFNLTVSEGRGCCVSA
jgi:hypothetical protein